MAARNFQASYDRARHRCADCGFGYSPEEASDRRAHRAYHDEWEFGVRIPTHRSETIIEKADDFELLLIDPNASEIHKRRGARIASNARRDTRFDFPSYDGGSHDNSMRTHAIVARFNDRAVGFLVFRFRDAYFECTWEQYDARADVDVTRKPCWSIDFVWTRRDLRRRGIARSLLMSASRVIGLPPNELGWQTPLAPAIEALLRKLCPEVVKFT